MKMIRWRYEDRVGIKREGKFVGYKDFGGTDVVYYFERDDGVTDLVSGPRLKMAAPIYEINTNTDGSITK